MRIEELKQAKDERPFRPFSIRMADGRKVPVTHPDAIAWEADPDDSTGEPAAPFTAVCIVPGGRWVVIELALITALEFQPQGGEGKAKKKGKGKDKGGAP
jgi:hypothetical protein